MNSSSCSGSVWVLLGAAGLSAIVFGCVSGG